MLLKKSFLMKVILFAILWGTLLFLDGGSASESPGEDDWTPTDEGKDEIQEWWQDFQKRHNYPLYCILLASTFDAEAAEFLLKDRERRFAMSGKGCCFIYFRDLRRMKQFAPFEFPEHFK